MSLLAGAGAGEMPPPPYAKAEPACLLVLFLLDDDDYDDGMMVMTSIPCVSQPLAFLSFPVFPSLAGDPRCSEWFKPHCFASACAVILDLALLSPV